VPVNPEVPLNYRLARGIWVRLIGTAVIGLAIVIFAGTAIVSVFKLPTGLLIGTAALGMAAVALLAVYFARRHYVVRLTEAGYAVRFLRGAGVMAAEWSDVEGVFSAHVSGSACLVIRLHDGRTTVIPVAALDTDRDEFATSVRAYLEHGHGLAPLT
jgi:hypothetical protein